MFEERTHIKSSTIHGTPIINKNVRLKFVFINEYIQDRV